MKKRILALLLVLLMSLSLFGCCIETENRGNLFGTDASEYDTTGSTVTPLLYKVTDENGNVAWLFGSIHVGLESYYPLPQYVIDAYNSSDALAVEVDIVAMERNIIGQIFYLRNLIYSDGTKISEHLPEDTYNRAVEILQENGMYNTALDVYMPSFWWSAIETISYEKIDAKAELGVDRHLLELAKEQKKEIREVESADFQYAMMGGFSEELQIMLLESAIAGYDDLEALKADGEVMMQLWAEGDEQAFGAYLTEEVEFATEEEERLYNEYNNKLIVERNKSMAEYAIDALESGDEVFICVGAAHIVGPGAVADILQNAGYTVEIVR